MKTYCTQNNGICSGCSLTSYGRDCRNNATESPMEEIPNDEMLIAIIAGARDAISRIEANADIVLGNLPKYAKMIDALKKLSAQKVMPII